MIQKRITSDIVGRLLALHHPDASDGADEIERLRDLVDDLRRCLVDDQLQIERLRAAGDALAEQMRLAIDARINEQLLLYGLATLPSEMPRSVVAWKEARRG